MGTKPLEGKVALVAGATRGAGRGIALSLGEAGAKVWCTGRSRAGDPGRGAGGSPFDLAARPETIDETARRVVEEGGQARAEVVDHTDPDQVAALLRRIEAEDGRLDVLVNDIWGGDALAEWGVPLWEQRPEQGFTMVDRVLRTHVLTLNAAVPLLLKGEGGLLVEVTDGDFIGYRANGFYDVAKMIPWRLALAAAGDAAARGLGQLTAVSITPGFLRSEAVLAHFGVTEATWEEGAKVDPHFAASETPRFVGRAIAALAADPDRQAKAGLLHSSWSLAREYGFTDVDGRRPDWGRHIDAWVEATLAKAAPLDEGERGLLLVRYQQLALDPRRLPELTRMAAKLGLPEPYPYPC